MALLSLVKKRIVLMKLWSSEERPREKLLAKGADALSDAELLAIILRTGIKGTNVVELARETLQKVGGLHQLFSLSKQDCLAIKGFGIAKYVELQAVLGLNKRYISHTLSTQPLITSVAAAANLFALELKHEQREIFACAFLNNQHELIALERLFYGSINVANVYPREIVKRALQLNASALILGHNHPSGSVNASQADKDITQLVQSALQLIDVKVLDHFIVGHKTVSMAELGFI